MSVWQYQCSTPTAQRQKSALIFSTRKLLVFRRSTSLGHVVDVTADVNNMVYFVFANKVYCCYGILASLL